MKKIERKDFLLMGGGAIAGGLTGYVFSGAPFLSFQWLVEWTQNQYVPTRGEERFLQKICEACPNKCEVSIRMISSRAVKVESSNNACPIGQSILQLLYHPERINKPLKRDGSKGSGKFSPVSWDEALKDISSKINGLIKNNKADQIAGINKDNNLSSDLLDRLIKACGSNNSFYEASEKTLARSALNGFVDYDFENTDYILSFGAKLLEGWGEESKIRKAFLNWNKKGTKLVQVDTNCSMTTSLASEWVPVKAGTESILALGIANYLIKNKGLSSNGRDFAKWSQIVINQYPIEKVSQLTGVDVKKIQEIAENFSRAKNPIAVAGRGAKGVSSSSAEIQAVYALNTMVRTGAAKLVNYAGLGEPVLTPAAAASLAKSKRTAGIDDFIKNSDFEMLIINEADPVFKSVLGNDLAKKMEKAFVVSIMPLINDTGLYSDYILPSLTMLEAQDSKNGPAVKPYKNSMHAGDIILNLAKKIESAAPSFTWGSYTELFNKSGAIIAANNDFAFNDDLLKNHLSDYTKEIGSSEFPLTLLPMELSYIGDGDGMAFPYALKTIDKHTYSGKKLWVLINRNTADTQGVSEGEAIDIISERGEIGSVYAHLTDTIAPDVVAIPLGFGHKAYTKYAEEKGVNPKEIMSDKIDPMSGSANWWSTRVKIS